MIITDTKYNLENEIVINSINELNNINIVPDILNITHINNKQEYKILLNYLKTIKGKTLIINDTDKYLKKILLNYLDIYRYGKNIYDDIEYKKYKDKIIFKYDSKIYEINTTNETIFGYILIKLLDNDNIEEIMLRKLSI